MNSDDVTKSPSWKELRKLAEKPYDLTAEDALTVNDRVRKMVAESAGVRLLYATQRVDEKTLAWFQRFADEQKLVSRFKDMRSGSVINKIEHWDSENRQVLHTSSRDIFSGAPREADSAAQAEEELGRLETFLKELSSGELRGAAGDRFDTVLNVGIGGSDLGPRAVYEALKAYNRPGCRARFIANVDPDDAAAILQTVNLSTTLVVVVSKSGTTQETLTNENLVRKKFQRDGLDPGKHFVAVTGKGSPMDNPSRYLRTFYMFDYIGGRYSVTSMVGCVTLGFALGYDQLKAFLAGAHEMDNAAEHQEVRNNVALLLALLGVWNRNFLGYPTLAVLPYSQALHRFPAHLQQCDMESNGKSITTQGRPVMMQTGPVLFGEPGTNGQHAFYQLLHQGTEVVPAEFIGFRSSQYGDDIEYEGSTSQQKLLANLLAQAVSLASGKSSENPNRAFAGNRPSSVIIAERLDPKTMGRLLALYEAKIVYQGFAWNINSFDQEGVQLGKVLAKRFLSCLSDGSKNGSSLEGQMLGVLEK